MGQATAGRDPTDDIAILNSVTPKMEDGYPREDVNFENFDNVFDPYAEANKQATAGPNRRVLGCTGLVAIAFFVGCGGPIGSEPIVAAGGPLIGLLAFLIYPILITIPYGYMMAELCSAFPEDGGFAVWVLNSFGPFWGVQVGYWSWLAGILNGALLPSFLLSVISRQLGAIGSPVVVWLIKSSFAILFAVPSILGTRYVAKCCVALLGAVFVPFLIFTFWGLVKADDFSHLGEVKYSNITFTNTHEAQSSGTVSVDWNSLINSLFWNFDGINMVSVFGGEVANPARVYARAIAITIALTVVTYVIPYPAAVASNVPHWSEYVKETYPLIAGHIGGQFLQGAITISSACSIIGLYISSTFVRSFQMSGMADNRLLPEVFSKRNVRFRTPHVSIMTTVMFTVALVGIDFDKLLPMTNAFSGACQLLTILSVMRLRRKLPYIPRPCKVPGNSWVIAGLATLPALVLFYITFGAFTNLFSASAIIVGLIPGIFYGFVRASRYRQELLRHSAMFI